MERLPEQAGARGGVRIVALLARGGLHRIRLVGGTKRVVHLVADRAGLPPGQRRETGMIRAVRRVTGGAITVGEGRMLRGLAEPAVQVGVTALAEGGDLLHQERRVGATVRLVAVGTETLGGRAVDDRPVKLFLNVAVTGDAEGTGALPQEAPETGHVGIVTAAALPGLSRGVGHLRVQRRGEIVVARETDLSLVDVHCGHRRGSGHHDNGEQCRNHDARECSPDHCPPPASWS
jgi:hypothetical protein